MPRATKAKRTDEPVRAGSARASRSSRPEGLQPRAKRAADGKKWIGGAPDDSWPAIARSMLAVRLHAVRRALSPAARQWEDDVEHVHQLRVASRRAGAALAVAADSLPKDKRRKISRQLRKIRRAAAEARDLDVLAARWRSDAKRAPLLEALKLGEELDELRRDAQRALRRADHRKWHRKFAKSIAKLTRRIRQPRAGESPLTLRSHATTHLSAMAQEFFEAPPVDPADHASLHELRIRAKRLRYAIEVLAGGLPGALREDVYPQIEELQELLGRVNDHAEAIDRLCLWSSMADPERHADYGRLIDLEIADLEQAKRRFLRFWSPARREALRQGFEQALAPQLKVAAG